MAKLVIFGAGPMAALAHFYFTQDSPHRVVGFAAERSTIVEPSLLGLPIVPVDEVERHFKPELHAAFVALLEGRDNRARAALVERAHGMGYAVASYVSSKASCWPDLRLEDNCFIMEQVTVQPYARLGRNIVLGSGCHVGFDARVCDHAYVGTQAVIGAGAEVGLGATIGGNVTIAERVKVGRESVIGAGCLVRADTPERQVIRDTAALSSMMPGKPRRRFGRGLGGGPAASAGRSAGHRGNGHAVRN